MIRIGLDTNILAYLAGVDRNPSDADKIRIARDLLVKLKDVSQLVAPTQTLGELFMVLVKAGASRDEARALAVQFHEAFEKADSASMTMVAAFDLAVTHRLQLWDALIISAAVDAGCNLLLSEDMQDGFSWRGLTIVNPFAEKVNAKLAVIIE